MEAIDELYARAKIRCVETLSVAVLPSNLSRFYLSSTVNEAMADCYKLFVATELNKGKDCESVTLPNIFTINIVEGKLRCGFVEFRLLTKDDSFCVTSYMSAYYKVSEMVESHSCARQSTNPDLSAY